MNLTDLQTFVRVAELGSFTRAARELGVPKSTVSRRVSRLEDSLGLSLLTRTGRRVSLTELGRRLEARTAGSLREIRDAERELVDAFEAPAGTLRLTAPHDLGATEWFALLVCSFREAHPGVRVQVELTNRIVDLVGEGVDVALRPRREGQRDAAALVTRRLAKLGARLYASARYLERRGVPTEPEALVEHDLLAHAAAGGIGRLRHDDGRSFDVPGEAVLVANDFNLLTHAVRAGAGIGMVPGFLSDALSDALSDGSRARGELVPVLEGWWAEGAALWLVWPESRHLAPRVRAFVDHAVGQVGELGDA